MAQINEATELPDVEPTTRGIDVHATPEAFGAPIAEGIKAVGAEAGQLGTFYDQVAADDATNNWHKKVNTILNGDPNDPDKPGYLNQKGADAMHGYAQMQQDLNDAEQEQRNTLGSARAKFEFDQDTRRTRFLLDQQTSGHYRQQYNEWQLKTNEDKLQGAKDLAANNPDDQNAIGLALTQAREAATATAQITRGKSFGQNPDDAQKEVDHADQQVRLAQFGAYMVSDPSKALHLLQSDGGAVLKSLPENQYVSLYRQAEEWAGNAKTTTQSDADVKYWQDQAAQAVSRSSTSAGSAPNNIGNVKTKENTFANPTTPQDGVVLAANNLRQGYRGLTLEQIANKWAPAKDGNNPAQWAATVSRVSGIQPGQVPNLDDPKQLQGLITGIGTAEKNKTDFGLFSPQTIAAGVSASLGGKQANLQQGAVATQTSFMSQSDFLLEHRDEAIERFRSEVAADPVFGGRADLIDKAVNSYEIRYNRQIRDQNSQYLVNTHKIEQAIDQGKLTSWDEVSAQSKEMAAAVTQLRLENPAGYHEMENWFKSNAGGVTKGYGTQFSDVLDRVLAPVGDPRRIEDPAKINGMIGPGENALITNSGASVLQQLLQARNQPGGEGNITQLRNYLNQAKSIVDPYTGKVMGDVWPQGQNKYAAFVGDTLKLVANERAQGEPMSEILAKGGAVDKLLGRSGLSLDEQRKAQREIVHDARVAPELAAQKYLRQSADVKYLQDGITQQKISRAQAAWAIKMGARSIAQLQEAYAAKPPLINREDLKEAYDHLTKYHRNFFGQPEL